MAERALPVDRAAGASSSRWRRGHVVAYFFFTALVGPGSDIVLGRTRPTWLAAAALTAFVLSFVLLVELGHHPGAPGPVVSPSPRRRWSERVLFGALVALAIATTIGFGPTWWVLFIFVSAATALFIPVRWAPAAIVLAALLAMAAGLRLEWSASSVGPAAVWAGSICMSGFVALLVRRRTLLIQELRAAQGEVARLAAADAVTEERLRIARDLHDLLGHSLSVIALKAELARRLLDREAERARVRVEVNDVEHIARRALDEVREVVTGYRTRSLEAELVRARAALEAAGVEVRTSVTACALPAGVDDLLAWVVREATTNIVRHSRAGHAEIALSESERCVRLEVCNDGVAVADGDAIADPAGGSGLLGLRERVADAGGSLTAGRHDRRGFRVLAVVPLGVPQPTAVPPAPREEASR
jgi:two-component system sensor histidine kinase DesK